MKKDGYKFVTVTEVALRHFLILNLVIVNVDGVEMSSVNDCDRLLSLDLSLC